MELEYILICMIKAIYNEPLDDRDRKALNLIREKVRTQIEMTNGNNY